MRCLRLALTAALAAPLGCMTLVKDPGQARASRPVTLGVPGALFHPGRSVGLLANLDVPSMSREHVVSGGRGEGAYSVAGTDSGEDDRTINVRETAGRLSFLHFPSNNSFFFWGLTSRYVQARAGYAEHTAGFNLDDPKTADVEWLDRYETAGGTLGTSIISQHDSFYVTTVFGLSVEGQVGRTRSFVNDGARHDVDTVQRDATLAAFDDVGKKAQFKYYLMSGYSF